MNKLGLIDAVMTDDSDVLMFGARVIIRKYVLKLRALHGQLTIFCIALSSVAMGPTMCKCTVRVLFIGNCSWDGTSSSCLHCWLDATMTRCVCQ